MPKKFKRFYTQHTKTPRHRVQVIKRASKKPLFFVPVLTFAILAGVVVGVLSVLSGGPPKLEPSGSNIVLIRYDKQERTIPTRAKNVGDLLKRLHITLRTGDVVEPSKDTEIIGDNFRVNIYRAVPVTVVDGDKKTFVYSAAATPRSIVRQNGIEVFPEDRLDLLPTENFLTEGSIGERVVIQRSYPITMDIYGKSVPTRTLAKTVQGLLEEKKVKLQRGDTVFPEADTLLTPGVQVFLLNKNTKIETAEEGIPAPVQKVEDNLLSFGTTAIRQRGSPGKKVVTYRIGQNGEKTAIQEVIVQPAITQIEATGTYFDIDKSKTAVMAAAGIAKSDYLYVDYIMSRESGWCPTKLQGQIGYCPATAPATVPSGRGYGLGQATPGTKMAPYGADWKSNPITQLKWATAYAKGRFGSWSAAYHYWQNNHHW